MTARWDWPFNDVASTLSFTGHATPILCSIALPLPQKQPISQPPTPPTRSQRRKPALDSWVQASTAAHRTPRVQAQVSHRPGWVHNSIMTHTPKKSTQAQSQAWTASTAPPSPNTAILSRLAWLMSWIMTRRTNAGRCFQEDAQWWVYWRHAGRAYSKAPPRRVRWMNVGGIDWGVLSTLALRYSQFKFLHL